MAYSTQELDQAVRSALRRIVPFTLLMFVLAFLDRVNVGFAKQGLQGAARLDDRAFALGLGLFFIGYAVCETPSNIMMYRVGARRWMSRIMVTWGVISALTAFVHSPLSFHVLRLVLGVAEAGFFPGIILYYTWWFPERTRAGALGLFYLGPCLAFIFGGPLSGSLLDLDGLAGLAGWQWMFVTEGLLAVVVGLIARWYLCDSPNEARWLTQEQSRALLRVLAAENAHRLAAPARTAWSLLRDRKTLYCAAIFLLIQINVYGVTFYLPFQIAKIIGSTHGLMLGVASAFPWFCALVACVSLGRWSDRTGERRYTAAAALAAGGAGTLLAAGVGGPIMAFAGLCLAAAGLIAVQPLYFAFPTAWLGGANAAKGLGIISSLAALGAFLGPNLRVLLEQWSHSTRAGFYFMATTTFFASGLIIGFPRMDLFAESVLFDNDHDILAGVCEGATRDAS
jgi:MFS family permease